MQMKQKSAFFISYPRSIADLSELHDLKDETPYEAVMRVKLSAIDYENFIADMTVERPFFAAGLPLCREGDVMKCILVQRRGHTDGVLVIPSEPQKDHEQYVKAAAYLSDAGDQKATHAPAKAHASRGCATCTKRRNI